MVVSKRQVDRAGQVLRDAQSRSVDEALLREALEVADWFRASHEEALDQARFDLLNVSRALTAREVGDRLKRLDTIRSKLSREPTLQLSRMRDIAGCRLVVASIEELEDVSHRLAADSSGKVSRIVDYVDSPRTTGYRGVHLVVRYADRLAEIQLRTQLMHRWAQLSEGIQGIETREQAVRGREPIAVWLRDLGDALAFQDRGETIPKDLQARVDAAPIDVVQALTVRWRS